MMLASMEDESSSEKRCNSSSGPSWAYGETKSFSASSVVLAGMFSSMSLRESNEVASRSGTAPGP